MPHSAKRLRSAPKKPDRRSRVSTHNRRGAILVVVAFLSVALLTVLAVVVDMSRMYNQKNELQTAADAGALAGMIAQLADTLTTIDSAVSFGAKNSVLQTPISVVSADVICGKWDDVTHTYLGDSDHCGATENAVTVTVRDSARYIFSGLLGTSKQITAMARAYAAYVGAQKCVKPWAIPYTTLTKTLQPVSLNPDTLRNLDTMDIRLLRTPPKDSFMLKIGTPPNSGNFGSLDIPNPDAKGGGANLYNYNIVNCNSTLIGPGDTINTETGDMKGPTDKGVADFCAAHGSFEKSTGNCYDTNHNLGIVTKAALWSYGTTKANGNFAVIIRQIVSFVLENLSSDTEITGYFLPINTSGAITTTVTTTQRPILVQ